MANQINAIPAFTTDETAVAGNQEVKQAGTLPVEEIEEEVPAEEKGTPSEQLPAEEKPAVVVQQPSEDIEKLNKVIQGLQYQAIELRKDIVELRGQRRELKEQQLAKVETQIGELKDVHPDDVATIEKILRAKGYVPKEEWQKTFYDSVKNEKLNQFLEKYPEYKPENDPDDTRWRSLQAELGFYRMPEDPHKVYDLLVKAHKTLTPVVSNDRNVTARQRQVQTAAVGAGGAQRSSSKGANLDPRKRLILEQGGWSEEEIKKIEEKL